ncbi:MAG: NAD(P)H-hydrate dehydratase, partial [Chlamydiae bacterium]|nr:NAD(P)H-hydrate dehydratase [Chlamydiota bacterium]
TLPDLAKLKKPNRLRDQHKYGAGYVIGYGGSKQFSGAPKLTSLAALKSGAGIVRLFYPDDAASNMINSFPELIHCVWDQSTWESEQKRASSIFVGPGLLPRSDLPVWFKKNLFKTHLPCVLDAEAMMVDPSYWPKEVILTPHRGEALRLLHLKTASDEELLASCRALADKTKAVIVLKGAPTFIIGPNQVPIIIPCGHPAMATAGAGDVLTGVIAALLAQKLSRLDAALLGAISHALAGEKAAETKTSYGLLASDLVEYLRF